jgi:hypothetical protein
MRVFTSEEIKQIQDKVLNGEKLTRTENIFYLADKDIKKSNVVINYTQLEMIEHAKCYSDKVYFIEKYLGIKLYNFQKQMIEHYNNNRFTIFMKSEQIGYAKIMGALQLHDIIFKLNHNILYVDNKGMNLVEFLDKIKQHYKKLPFFLKPGVISWNLKNIVFDNGNRIMTQSATPELNIGYTNTINTLILNNFADIPDSISKSLYSSVIPTISTNNNNRIVISSAPNGHNFFIELVQKSELKNTNSDKNMYETMRIYWWDVPGRDETWKQDQIKIIGEELFLSRYEFKYVVQTKKKYLNF